jgi:hypothetical protein
MSFLSSSVNLGNRSPRNSTSLGGYCPRYSGSANHPMAASK